MSATHDPDRIFRAWLEQMPSEAPDRAMSAVLEITATMPQAGPRIRAAFPRRPITTRFALAAVALPIIVFAALTISLGVLAPDVGRSTPRPTQTQATPELLPSQLQSRWVGAPGVLTGLPSGEFLTLNFSAAGRFSAQIGGGGPDELRATLRSIGPELIELTSSGDVTCAAGDVGRYAWSVSPGGGRLHLAGEADACRARQAAIAGDWYRSTCDPARHNTCWGELEAGIYPTIFFDPRLDPEAVPSPAFGAATFTVPAGWAEADDWPSNMRLTRSEDFEREGRNGPVGQPTGVEAWIRPAANLQGVGCPVGVDARVARTPAALVTWITSLPGIVAANPTDLILDGHSGVSVDVQLAPDWTRQCGADPGIQLITEAVGSAGPLDEVDGRPYVVGLVGQARMRLVFVDPAPDHTLMFLVTAPDQATFDKIESDAMSILTSFRFP